MKVDLVGWYARLCVYALAAIAVVGCEGSDSGGFEESGTESATDTPEFGSGSDTEEASGDAGGSEGEESDAGATDPDPEPTGEPCESDGDCDDGAPCSTGVCAGGFCDIDYDHLACADWDPLTLDWCEPGPDADETGCVQRESWDACPNGGLPVCTMTSLRDEEGPSPEPGAYAVCPFRIAAASAGSPTNCQAVAMQGSFTFDADVLSLVDFYDESCFPDIGCFNIAVTGFSGGVAQPLSTGHSVSAAPMAGSAWNADGGGAVVVVNLSDPSALFSQAWWQDGAVEGDSVVFEMYFRVNGGGSDAGGSQVCVANALQTNADSSTLVAEILPDGTFVTDCP